MSHTSATFALVIALATSLHAQSADSIVVDTSRYDLAPIAVGLTAPVRSIGSTRRSLDSIDVGAGARPRTFSELLQARLPGVSVLRYGGDPSDGSRIRLRGTTTLIGDPAPVVVIDGVPVNTPELLGSSGSRTWSSRFDDFDPEEIERLDVLFGPAATTLFGAGTSNGAIVITTKRGLSGSPHWRAWSQGALSSEPTAYPGNFRQAGTNPATGNPATSCDIVAIANQQCSPTTLDFWNPLESASPFRQGRYGAGGVSVAGGPFGIRAYASAIGRAETGMLDSSWGSRVNARLNAERELFGRVTVGGNLGYVRRHGMTRSDEVIVRGLLGTAVDDANRGYLEFRDAPTTDRRGDRLSRSARVEWRALSWLRVHGMVGRDEVTQRDFSKGAPFGAGEPELHATTRHWLASSIVHGTAEAQYHPTSSVGLRTLVSYEESSHRAVEDERLTRGDLFSFSWSKRWSSIRSWMVQERVDVADRIFVNLGARRIAGERSWNGARWHPSVDAAWDLGRLTGDPALRLRGAYAVGIPPRDTATEIFFVGTPTGSPIEPEQPREAEIGFDVRFGSRVEMGGTVFDQRTPKLITMVLGSSGLGFVLVPTLGKIDNRGLELAARIRLLDLPATRWSATITLATLRNRVSGLDHVPPWSFVGPGVRNGQPFGVFVNPRVTFVDANGDNLPVPAEITFEGSHPDGTIIPTREISFRSELGLPQSGVVLSLALDHRSGHRAYNLFDYYQCAGFRTCRDWQDPSTSLADKVTAVASSQIGRVLYLENASYTRLAEVGLEWTPPARFGSAISNALRLGIEARNLVTWTGFRGPDPEVASASLRQGIQPFPMLPGPPRTIGVRVEVVPR
jgi:hypothetical protein